MLMLPPSVRIYLARDPVDMRKSFDGLSALVAATLGHDPLSGHLFLFRSRTGHLMKVLYRDRSGWCLFSKRLERGAFRWPAVRDQAAEIEAGDLACLIDGIDLRSIRRLKRWQPGECVQM
jgi:transposase